MKIIALGDTHGRTIWKEITTADDFDKVVFIGDYFDTHEDISAEQQMRNFEDIVAFKSKNSDKVILLFGNHDFHYLSSMDERYSGYNRWNASEIEEMLLNALALGLMQMCFVHETFLFTHAGVTKTWSKANNIDLSDIETSINNLFRYQPGAFKFTTGRDYSPYGDEICQTPIWVRPDSLQKDAVEGYTHVVGHTTQDQLVLTRKVVLIDTLGTSGEYLSILNGKMSVNSRL